MGSLVSSTRLCSTSNSKPNTLEELIREAAEERASTEPLLPRGLPRFYEVIGTEREGGLRTIIGFHGDPEKWAWGYNPGAGGGGMFAVIAASGRQYKVIPGDILYTEKLAGDVNERLKFDRVLLVGTREWTAIGRPLVSDALVEATVEEIARTSKVYKYTFRKRKNSKKVRGHRQWVVRLLVNDIVYKLPEDRLLKLYKPPNDQRRALSEFHQAWRVPHPSDATMT